MDSATKTALNPALLPNAGDPSTALIALRREPDLEGAQGVANVEGSLVRTPSHVYNQCCLMNINVGASFRNGTARTCRLLDLPVVFNLNQVARYRIIDFPLYAFVACTISRVTISDSVWTVFHSASLA
jgi:hypothetical protein